MESYVVVKRLNEVNAKKYSVRDLVYFIDPYDKHKFDWGIVSDIYSDGYCLDLYELRDIRTVEGVPIAEYDFDQPKRKLPKGWSWDTDLVHLGEDPKWVKIMKGEKFTYEEDNLCHLIDIGLLVRPYSQDKACDVESDIEKDGYTIKKTRWHYRGPKRSQYAIVHPFNVYATWQEAQAVVDAYEAELKRQAELSDYDWSVEQIDKALDRWHGMYEHSKAECKAIRDFLLSQKNVEDIAVRIISEGFQWKYEKNKKWMTVEMSY